MRKLTHILTLHDIPPSFLKKVSDPEELRKIHSYHRTLRKFYDEMSLQMEEVYAQEPIHHIYLEGYDGSSPHKPCEYGFTKPVDRLIKLGAKLEVTEHRAAGVISSIFDMITESNKDFFNWIENLREKRVNKGIDVFRKLFKGADVPYLTNLLSEFFSGLEFADLNAARENWIGRNIDATLKDGENGILFLGRHHGTERIRGQIEGEIDYTVLNPFKTPE